VQASARAFPPLCPYLQRASSSVSFGMHFGSFFGSQFDVSAASSELTNESMSSAKAGAAQLPRATDALAATEKNNSRRLSAYRDVLGMAFPIMGHWKASVTIGKEHNAKTHPIFVKVFIVECQDVDFWLQTRAFWLRIRGPLACIDRCFAKDPYNGRLWLFERLFMGEKLPM
jgi:hypothetical protein